MTLGNWYDLALFLCGFVAAIGVMGLALEMRRQNCPKTQQIRVATRAQVSKAWRKANER